MNSALRRWPRATRAALAVLGFGVAVIAISNAWVLLSARGESTSEVDAVPHTETAIVLGASVNPDGTMSAMLADRVERAAQLWRAGKVDRLLVSGEHDAWSYDEPDTMRQQLVRDGVPAHAIFEDHAGFDTWSTMVRARKVFGVKHAVVITQAFHMPRSLYLAKAAGVNATGLTSDIHPYGSQQTRSDVREVGARVKAAADATLDTGVLLGPRVPITGDGRSSWGPAPPAGTPGAGSPGG
jgi:SanA protein